LWVQVPDTRVMAEGAGSPRGDRDGASLYRPEHRRTSSGGEGGCSLPAKKRCLPAKKRRWNYETSSSGGASDPAAPDGGAPTQSRRVVRRRKAANPRRAAMTPSVTAKPPPSCPCCPAPETPALQPGVPQLGSRASFRPRQDAPRTDLRSRMKFLLEHYVKGTAMVEVHTVDPGSLGRTDPVLGDLGLLLPPPPQPQWVSWGDGVWIEPEGPGCGHSGERRGGKQRGMDDDRDEPSSSSDCGT
jgi:hypothetical protein